MCRDTQFGGHGWVLGYGAALAQSDRRSPRTVGMIRAVGEQRTRRIVLATWGAAVAALPLLWVYHAARGSQEFVNDDGEIRDTLASACVVLLLWAPAVGAVVQPLWRSLLVAGTGGALALAALGGALRWGHRRIDRTHSVLEPAFWERMTWLALRGLVLMMLGVTLGYAIRGIAERLGRRPRTGLVALAVLVGWAVTEALGSRLPQGRFQLSTYIAGWLHGQRLVYRPTADCPAGSCSVYHATWQRSLPVLTAVVAVALLVGRLCRTARPSTNGLSADDD